MKVLMISSTLPPYKCGVGDYTYCLTEQINKEGVDISVLSTSFFYQTSAFNVLPLIKDWNDFSILKTIIDLCHKEKYDIVHIQMPTAMYGKGIVVSLIIPILKMFNIKTVLTLHEYSFSTFGYRVKLLPSLLMANRIIVVEPDRKSVV